MSKKILKLLRLNDEDLPLINGKCSQKISDSKEAYKLLKKYFNNKDIKQNESFKILLLDEDFKVIKVSHIADGDENSCKINLKEMFKEVLVNNTDSIVICHNHPTGNLTPTADDNVLTRNIQRVCNLLNINLLDHIIISTGGYYSYSHNEE